MSTDPYADLRRTTAAWLALPSASSSVTQGGHTSVTGRHHPGPGVDCPEPWCAYHYAANPDTIAQAWDDAPLGSYEWEPVGTFSTQAAAIRAAGPTGAVFGRRGSWRACARRAVE